MEAPPKEASQNAAPPTLWALFTAFMRIGAFTFGGGYAMLPMLERECVEKTGWTSREELLDYFAIGQCTPGVIAVNTATFIGKKQRGFWGALVATTGVVLPSFIIICILTALISGFSEIRWVRYALRGIRVAVGVLILNTVIKLIKQKVNSLFGWLLCVFAFLLVALAFIKLNPVFVVIAAALCGIVRGFVLKKSGKEGKA